MKKFIILALLFVSCGTKKIDVYVCTCDQRRAVSEFIERNISAANNMSDEEMEYVINKLYWIGVRINCESRIIEVESITPFLPITKLDSCEFIMNN